MNHLSFANRVDQSFHLLSKKERVIIDYLFSHQQEATTITINQLSAKTNSSNATITRVIQKLAYTSFSAFKTYLSQELAQIATPISTEDDLALEIASYYSQTIKASIEFTNNTVIELIVQSIQSARKILIIGLGSSSLSGLELKYRLMRLDLNIDVVSDAHTMLMQLSLLSKDDLVICITNSGSSVELARSCAFAKKLKIPIYTITNKNHTPITALSNYVIFTSSVSAATPAQFINSQLAIMFCIDIICYKLLSIPQFAAKRTQTLEALKLL
ncbi:MAG: MurR/RpiR family transcriptional regulator [Culicoidibacterales bacterium]